MIKFNKSNEKFLKEKMRVVFTLVATLAFCVTEMMGDAQEFSSLVFKIVIVILLFYIVIGRILTQILYLLLKEIVEDQTEVEEDKQRREELREFERIEKAEIRDNVQKVKF